MEKIAYFEVGIEGENYVGGIMITDVRGIPIEFKYTDPIKPTKIQKILYGAVLEKYLREEIIIKNLVGKLETKPDIYIINDNKNIELEKYVKKNVVLVKKTQLKEFSNVKEKKDINESEMLFQMNEGESPLRLLFGEKGISRKEEILETLIQAKENIDLIEPLERMREALRMLCNGEL
ncbi:MAG: hypothetical protein B6I28_00245 [Fusobacteriia bacterium 4572_132]|nr:MAG: hypothetical protein B6I28_00245 [Fusobacteriia bacterium 4572_132]